VADSGLFEEALLQLREVAALLDREGNLLWMNAAAARRLGGMAGPVQPRPVMDWVAAGAVPQLMRSLIAVETGLTPTGERISLPLTLRTHQGGTSQLVASVSRIEAGGEHRVLLLARSRRSGGADDGLLPSQADFLANMSHELRTPLNAIIGYAELLGMPQLTVDPDKRRQYADDIRDSGRHLLELIEDILEFAKAGAGRMTIRAEELDVVEELESCIKLAEGLAVRMGRPLDMVLLPDGQPGVIRTDVRLFKQVVVNLLSNAVKFSRAGGRVELAVRRVDQWLQVAVRDQGVGIPAEEADRIFAAFYQVDGTASRQYGGMGLGLALVRRFLDLLGGGIRLQSKPGVGSTFTFHIPVDARRGGDAGGLARVQTQTGDLPALIADREGEE